MLLIHQVLKRILFIKCLRVMVISKDLCIYIPGSLLTYTEYTLAYFDMYWFILIMIDLKNINKLKALYETIKSSKKDGKRRMLKKPLSNKKMFKTVQNLWHKVTLIQNLNHGIAQTAPISIYLKNIYQFTSFYMFHSFLIHWFVSDRESEFFVARF